MITRRGFFHRTLGGLWVATLAPYLPVPASTPRLVFHPDAFAFVMANLREAQRQHNATQSQMMESLAHGISIRFIQQWDIRPEWACRIEG